MKPVPADLDCSIQSIYFISILVSDRPVCRLFAERLLKEATQVLLFRLSHSHVPTLAAKHLPNFP
jgi:hypothetical protein